MDAREWRKTRNNCTLVASCKLVNQDISMPKLKNSQGAAKRVKKTGYGQGGSRTCVRAPYTEVQSQEAQA